MQRSYQSHSRNLEEITVKSNQSFGYKLQYISKNGENGDILHGENGDILHGENITLPVEKSVNES